MPKFLDTPQWYGSSTSSPLSLWETAGSSGQYLSSNGSGNSPTWKAITTYPHSLSGICVAVFDNMGSVQHRAVVVVPVDWNISSLSSSNTSKFSEIISNTFSGRDSENSCSFPVYGGRIQFPTSSGDLRHQGSVILGQLQNLNSSVSSQNVKFDYIDIDGNMANATFPLSQITSCLYWQFDCDTGYPDSTFSFNNF